MGFYDNPVSILSVLCTTEYIAKYVLMYIIYF